MLCFKDKVTECKVAATLAAKAGKTGIPMIALTARSGKIKKKKVVNEYLVLFLFRFVLSRVGGMRMGNYLTLKAE